MNAPVTVYGISNCDTIRKARAWLTEHGVDYDFHDYRKNGLERAQLEKFAAGLGWEAMLNRRGTTWRNLPEADRNHVDESSAIDLMLQHPAMMSIQ